MFHPTGPSKSAGFTSGTPVTVPLDSFPKNAIIRVALGDSSVDGKGVHAILSFGTPSKEPIELFISGPSSENFKIPAGAKSVSLTTNVSTTGSLTVGEDI